MTVDDTGTTNTPTPTLHHTWLIIIGALVLLWVLGRVFKSVRQ